MLLSLLCDTYHGTIIVRIVAKTAELYLAKGGARLRISVSVRFPGITRLL